jgi:hypothetical protein
MNDGTSDGNLPSKSSGELSSRESLRDQNINHLNLFSPGKTTVLQVTFGKNGEVYVQPSAGAGSRSPTMSECKDIIHYLEDTNKKQGQEVRSAARTGIISQHPSQRKFVVRRESKLR